MTEVKPGQLWAKYSKTQGRHRLILTALSHENERIEVIALYGDLSLHYWSLSEERGDIFIADIDTDAIGKQLMKELCPDLLTKK